MQFKKLVFITLCLFSVSFSVYGETPKVRFYPQEELTFCKGCFGHFKEDGWRFKFKLENLSGKDLIVYGHRVDEKEFIFINEIQYKNPDICEWQYSYGSSGKRCDWKCMPSFYKDRIIVKAGESIETEGGAFENNKIPERYTAYIAESPNEDAHEIFSEPYLLVKSPDKNKKEPVLKIVDEECKPNCNLSIEQSANIRGIKLETTLAEFIKNFPKATLSNSTFRNYKLTYARLWDWNNDAYNLNLTFLDEKVVRIEAQFKSLEDTRWRTDFYRLIAEKIQLHYFWEPYRGSWECEDFLIEVLTNKSPTITIWNKEFIKIHDIMAEEDLKKYK